MLLGFISLLLTVFQSSIIKICVEESVTHHLLSCKFESGSSSDETESTTHHWRLLAEGVLNYGYCAAKNKVPLLSIEALHYLHIFIFVLAIVHVVFCVFTVVFGGLKICQWKSWEDSIAKDNYDTQKLLRPPKLTHVHQHDFIRGRFLGIGKNSVILDWLDKVPLLSIEALHHLQIFIFVLSIVHVVFCVFTVVFGGLKIRPWKSWEDSIAKVLRPPKLTHVNQHDFIKGQFSWHWEKLGYFGLAGLIFQAILWICCQIRLHGTKAWLYYDTLQGYPKVQFSQVHDAFLGG